MFIETHAGELKPEHGTGFKGIVAVFECDHGKLLHRLESPIMADLFTAGRWAYDTAHTIIGDRSCRVGHYSGNRWRKNYWIA